MIITIDGPAGSGKSTIAKKLAKILEFDFFDTGAMYRAITWYILENKIDFQDDKKIKNLLEDFSFNSKKDANEKRYFVNKKEVTTQIRSHIITENVSTIAAKKFIRQKLVKLQRKYAQKKDVIFEGRDMGSVVFPYADIKFFLTAKLKKRAKRRFLELLEKFPETTDKDDYNKILKDLKKRDKIDTTRKHSPLKKADNAYVIDTSKLNIDQVTKKLIKKIKKDQKKKNRTIPSFFKMKPLYALVLFGCWLWFKIFYRLKVYGIKNFIEKGAIIASNHISFYDPIAVAISSKDEIHFLARESLFKIFLFGKLIKKLNAHKLKRNVADVIIFKKIIKLLKADKKVLIFPEGERAFEGKIQKIKPGIGLLCYFSKKPIIPTYVSGTYNVWGRKKKWPKLFGKIKVVFGSPINFENFENVKKKEFMKEVETQTEKALKGLQKWCENNLTNTPP